MEFSNVFVEVFELGFCYFLFNGMSLPATRWGLFFTIFTTGSLLRVATLCCTPGDMPLHLRRKDVSLLCCKGMFRHPGKKVGIWERKILSSKFFPPHKTSF